MRYRFAVEADFADLFEVKEAQIHRHWDETRELGNGSLALRATWHDVSKGIVVRADGAEVGPDVLTYRTDIPAHGFWGTRLTVLPDGVDSPESGPVIRPDLNGLSPRDVRHQQWVDKIPVLQMGNPSIERILSRSYKDLGALRIENPDHPDRVVVAAGAPWFMALFGRDSLWASQMALPVDPSLALGTLQTLADSQGNVVDLMTEEEPGKILHEVRLDVDSKLVLGGKSAYYGSVDSTPLFVGLIGEVSRWGFARESIAALLPYADRALNWIRDYGDKDGDGFVEYQRLNDRGLINQGWKDSWDGINFADGTLPKRRSPCVRFRPTSTEHT